MKKATKILTILAVLLTVLSMTSCMNAFMGAMGMYYFENESYELIFTEDSSAAGGELLFENKHTGEVIATLDTTANSNVEFKVNNKYYLYDNYVVTIVSKKEVKVTNTQNAFSETLKRGDIANWAMSQ